MKKEEQFIFRFMPSGRGKAQCEPDPKYPNGMDVNISTPGAPTCEVDIPYPAPECGMYKIHCKTCHNSWLITVAGRPDDPKHVKFNCMHKVDRN